MHKNTRQWAFKGYTFKELFEKEEKQLALVELGRNIKEVAAEIYEIGASVKLARRKPFKQTIACLLCFVILPYLVTNLIFDLIIKGSFSGFRWDALAVICVVFLATDFILKQTKFR